MEKSVLLKQEQTVKNNNGSLIKSPKPSNLSNIKIFHLMLEAHMSMHTRLTQDGTNTLVMKMED